MLKNSSLFILRTSQLLTKFQVQRIPKAYIKECTTCGISKYSTGEHSKSDYSDPKNVDYAEDFDFQLNEEMTDDYMEKLCDGDEKKRNKLKYTRFLVSLLRDKGSEIPKHLSEKNWLRLLSYERKQDQIKYLHNLHLRETNRKLAKAVSQIENNKYKKMKQEEQEQGPINVTTSGPVIYRLRYNTLFYRILDCTIDKLYNYRLLQSMMFAPTVVIDCGFESSMQVKEIDMVAAQMIRVWAYNRNHVSPFHLQFCNLSPNGRLMERLKNELPTMDDPAFPFFHTSKSYMELFPQENLVYLSPDAKYDLVKFSNDEIYILGGLSTGHIHSNFPLSRMKAQKEGLRVSKFPLKQYNVKLNQNQHSLELRVVLAILNDLKETNDWKYAIRHINERQLRIVDHPSEMPTRDHLVKSRQRLQMAYDLLLRSPVKGGF